MNKIVIIGGATASGKTSLGVEIAKMLDSEIISCDSMQIYRHMDIGTAKVTTEESHGIRHHMIDVVEPNCEYSVGEFAKEADKKISEIQSKGKIPVLVGGTGLYLDAILYPMSFGGERDEKLRKDLFDELEKFGKDYMYNKLKAIDPVDAAKIHPNNTKRVLRALEIYYSTGEIKSDLVSKERQLRYDPCMVVLNPPREILYQRINSRVDKMFTEGLEKEVKTLVQNGVGFDFQSMQAIGYKEFSEYFDGLITLEQLKEKIKQNSRNYAKRQITWLKKYNFAKWFDPLTERQSCIDYVSNSIRRS